MSTQKVEVIVPEELVPFLVQSDQKMRLNQYAMLLYPYIQDNTISFGKAAEILEMPKLDLIALYGDLGLPYIRKSQEELK